jgi:hypothetical protein
MKFILNRDRTVASTLGHAIAFKKGVPTHVPPEMYSDVIAAGAVPEEELTEKDIPKADHPTDPTEREAALFEAFEALVLRNDSADFTAGGIPRDNVLERAVGFKVSSKEREAAWTKFKIGEDA